MDLIEKHQNYIGKYNSAFLFIAFSITCAEFIEKVKHQLNLTKNMKDNVKKNYLCKKLYEFIVHLSDTKNKDVTIINNLYLITEKIIEIPLDTKWIECLKMFDYQNYLFMYSDRFDLCFIKNLLMDTSYTNVFHMNNNQISHIWINSTKKRVVKREEIKSLNIVEHIKNKNINEKSIIHGVSASLKNFTSDYHHIFHKNLSDEQILDFIEKEKVKKNCDDLKNVLDNLTNPKIINKIVFGKDVGIKIQEQMLEKMFCSPEMLLRLEKNIPKEFWIFEVKVIPSFNNSDIGYELHKKYGGCIGICFY